ncbi:MAG: DUF4007 family protein [Acetobacteraceae bacterium]|nr:DUF4007 family protein [Acetobacteraceae bacterium]
MPRRSGRHCRFVDLICEAAGLAENRQLERDGKKTRQLHTSEFGEAVLHRDPYLEYPATWWFIHLNLARRSWSIWGWFFNEFRERSFDRASCVEAYLRYLRLHAAKEPTTAVAQADIACLLLAYASRSGSQRPDPEDGTSSPLRDLGLLVQHEDTGRFERTRPLDEVPLECFLACVGAAGADRGQEAISISEMLSVSGGPGRIFGLTADGIEDMAIRSARQFSGLGISLDLLGAEQCLRVRPEWTIKFWLNMHFDRIGAGV